MKYFIATAIILFSLFAATIPGAQKLYTWTDENGVLHITEQPPPKSAKVENVMTYRKKTPEELAAIERRKEKIRREFERQEQLDRKQEAGLKAKQDEEQARKAKEQAEKEYNYNKEYIKRLSSTKRKRRQFRKKIERLKKETEQSFDEAKSAAEKAEEARQTAAEEGSAGEATTDSQ
jgi:wobble nucleotide-excising tRNase